MELFILTALQLLIEVQSYEVPNIKVSPDVIRESDSVYVTCERPAHVTVSHCYFYTNEEKEKNIKVSQSCQLILTGAEILSWTAEKSPVSLNIGCYYTTDVLGVNKPSPSSPSATVTILDSLRKPIINADDSTALIMIACEIPVSVRADFTCNLYTEDGPLTHRSHSQRRQSGEHSCLFYLSLSEIFTHKQTKNSRQLSCDYSVKTEAESKLNLRSPHSDTYTIRGFPQAKLTVSSSVIMERDSVQLICKNIENQKMDVCFFTVDGKESNVKQSRSCQLSLTGSDIINWSGGQRSSVIITCYYSVNKSKVLVPSPQSDPVTVTVQISTAASTEQTTTVMRTSVYVLSKSVIHVKSTTHHTAGFPQAKLSISSSSITDKATVQLISQTIKNQKMDKTVAVTFTTVKTTYCTAVSTANPTHKDLAKETKSDTWLITLLAVLITGVGVFMSVLIGLICLCRFVRKKRSKSVSSQVIAGSTVGSGPGETYSLITSVPSQPTDALVNTQHKEGHPTENEL